MMIVAGISSPEDVNDLVSITKSFVVANRAKELAHEVRTG
jgi:hypothetical protein